MADSRSPTAPCQEGPSRPIFTFKVLDGELPVAAAEEGEESKHVEQDADHGTAIVPGSEPEDQRLVCRSWFWRRTGRKMFSIPHSQGGQPCPQAFGMTPRQCYPRRVRVCSGGGNILYL